MGIKVALFSRLFSCVGGGSRYLLTAAERGDAATVRETLESRPELAKSTCLFEDYNCLHYAAASGQLSVCRAIVDTLRAKGKVPVIDSSNTGKSPRKVQSISIRWDEVIGEIINHGGTRNVTPLMLACQYGHVEVVKYLLQQGADPFEIDTLQGRSCIHYAAMMKQAGVLRVLLDDALVVPTGEGMVPLKDSKVYDLSGRCRYVDTKSDGGLTALHMACSTGDLQCVNLLLTNGASIMVKTVDSAMPGVVVPIPGSTPLHLAAEIGAVAIIQALLQSHVDALGTLGRNPETDGPDAGRRPWEGDGRMDIRTIRNARRQLPYQVARVRAYREAAMIMDPRRPVDQALEECRENAAGWGPHTLQTLAAMAVRSKLLTWLDSTERDMEEAAKRKLARQEAARVGGAAAAAAEGSPSTPQSDCVCPATSREGSPMFSLMAVHVANATLLDVDVQQATARPPQSPFERYAGDQEAAISRLADECQEVDEMQPIPETQVSLVATPSRPVELKSDQQEVPGVVLSTLRSLSRTFSSGRSLGYAAMAHAQSGCGSKTEFCPVSRQESYVEGFAADLSDEDIGCGICLDRDVEVRIHGCKHRMCVTCARSLCLVHKKPPMCPYCRRTVTGFDAMNRQRRLKF